MMYLSLWCVVVFFFVKQKTAYEMRISDWSSDVCSSDLAVFDQQLPEARCAVADRQFDRAARRVLHRVVDQVLGHLAQHQAVDGDMATRCRREIGRASCRERVCQYV